MVMAYYCYGMTLPQNMSLTLNKAHNDLSILFSNSLVNWKVDSQLLKESLTVEDFARSAAR